MAAITSQQPVIPVDVDQVHNQAAKDFSDEVELMQYMRPNRWLAIDFGGYRAIRCNWVVFGIASLFLWIVTICTLTVLDEAGNSKPVAEFDIWKSWIAQNFDWFYVGSQTVWVIFIVWLAVSKYGNIKLGKDHEKPEHSNIAYFAMLFACGIAVGVYYWGVSEPIYYYRGGKLYKPGFYNDDQRAQQAMTVLFFHWGVHAWVCYLAVAVVLALVSYRWDMPMTIRSAFYPLIGNTVYGPVGDLIDSLSMACTTFGVCTSLGFGATSIAHGFYRVNKATGQNSIPKVGDPGSIDWQIGIIWVITCIATISVVLGLHRGIKKLSVFTFALGCFTLTCLLFLDNTWFLLNNYVQSLGHYIQWVIQLSFETDTWQMLSHQFTESSSQLWDAQNNKLLDPIVAATNQTFGNPEEYFGSHPNWWIESWTIFYWGWWISWAPFVGTFIARISRGRTVREVVAYVLLAPCIYSFLWLSIYGGLGIKMERVAELALNVKPDVDAGTIDCAAMGYVGGEPVSDNAIKLAELGQFALACRNHDDRLYDMLAPYGHSMHIFLMVLNIVGLTLYFVTSSDSGSMIDDLLSAGGLYGAPPVQKIYWAATEGALATALLAGGGAKALGALQAVSIIAGFPYTLAICMMCTSIYRVVLWDTKDPEMRAKTRFITGLFDFSEGFQPADAPANAPGVGERLFSLIVNTPMPFYGLHSMNTKIYGTMWGAAHTAGQASFLTIWLALLIAETSDPNASFIAWTFYICFVVWETGILIQARSTYNVWGLAIEDFFKCLIMPMFVASQLELQAKYGDAQVAAEGKYVEYPTQTIAVPQQQIVFASGVPMQPEMMMSSPLQAVAPEYQQQAPIFYSQPMA